MSDANHDPGQPAEDNRTLLRQTMRGRRKAALATLSAGAPYVSLTAMALDQDLSVLLLLSDLADHTRNLRADARASLLFDGTDGLPNPQTGPRVTVTGRAEICTDPAAEARYLAMHPAAAQYAGFGDFNLWRVVPERAHFVGGFGRAVWFDAPFGLDGQGIAAFRTAQDDLIRRLNQDACDELSRITGRPDRKAVGIDADGADFFDGESFFRLNWPRRIDDPARIPALLSALPTQTLT